jgi:hypothetical protein
LLTKAELTSVFHIVSTFFALAWLTFGWRSCTTVQHRVYWANATEGVMLKMARKLSRHPSLNCSFLASQITRHDFPCPSLLLPFTADTYNLLSDHPAPSSPFPSTPPDSFPHPSPSSYSASYTLPNTPYSSARSDMQMQYRRHSPADSEAHLGLGNSRLR